MLGIFFLLVWVTVIAALTSHDRGRSRPLLPEHIDDEFKTAIQQHDHAVLARYYRLALKRSLPKRDEQLVRINLACALNGLSEHAQALEELDRIDLSQLLPAEVALWLNNRAYTLVFLGQPTDALDNLVDADELLAGDDGLSRDGQLVACISGTRGIAQLHLSQLDEAEKSLQLALHKDEEGQAQQFDPEAQTDSVRAAERWFWLGEVARKRGEPGIARKRYERAAAAPTAAFGRRAQEALKTMESALLVSYIKPKALPAAGSSTTKDDAGRKS